MNNKGFCTKCGQEVKYIIKSKIVQSTIKGVLFNYTELSAHCVECGSNIYVPEINDNNAESMEKAYWEAKKDD